MAFLRAEKKKSGTYIRIVETFRKDGQIKHKTLYSLGKTEDYEPEQLKSIGEKFIALAGLPINEIASKSFRELKRVNYGYPLIINKLFEFFELNTLCRRINRKHKTEFDWVNCLKIMLVERLNEPCSKRQNFFHSQEYIGLQQDGSNIQLHHFYRTLDLIFSEKELIQNHLYACYQNLFSCSLDLVFYDVTTLYFDSQVVIEDSLRQKGFSKDGKPQKTQVVLGLLVDKDRNPIDYQLYPGNTYEGNTLQNAVQTLKDKYNIDRIVVVADSAMINKSNREVLERESVDYIIGDRLKSLPDDFKNFLIDRKNHVKIAKESDVFSYLDTDYQGRRLICTYSEKRAKKDAFMRDKLIEKARQMVANPSQYQQMKKKGAGKFVTSNENNVLSLNELQIEEDKKFDGFKAISTSTKLPVVEILEKYSDLFEVEHAFRALKSTIEIRPMFHWTDQRIEAHVLMCFIAYQFLNHLKNQTGESYQKINSILDKMQLSVIEQDG